MRGSLNKQLVCSRVKNAFENAQVTMTAKAKERNVAVTVRVACPVSNQVSRKTGQKMPLLSRNMPPHRNPLQNLPYLFYLSPSFCSFSYPFLPSLQAFLSPKPSLLARCIVFHRSFYIIRYSLTTELLWYRLVSVPCRTVPCSFAACRTSFWFVAVRGRGVALLLVVSSSEGDKCSR